MASQTLIGKPFQILSFISQTRSASSCFSASCFLLINSDMFAQIITAVDSPPALYYSWRPFHSQGNYAVSPQSRCGGQRQGGCGRLMANLWQ